MAELISDRELLWRQYALHVDLYKFYIEATIKVNAFHYAITGAILSFYFTRTDISLARWSLVLPLVLSLGLAGLFGYGAFLLDITRKDVFEIRDQLGLKTAPEFKVLGILLRLFALVHLLTGWAILGLILIR